MNKIKHKVFFAVGTVVLTFIMVLIVLLSTTFSKYVRAIKKNEILKVYNVLNKATQEQQLSNEYISEIEYKYNLRINIRKGSTGENKSAPPPAGSPAPQQGEKPMHAPPPNFNRNYLNIERYKSYLNDYKYIFIGSNDLRKDTNAITFIGLLDSGLYMTCVVPISFIEENIKYTISFIGYAGIVALLLCVVISYYVAKKITNPIIEISAVTEKISQLDFNEKCIYDSTDELGMLSRNVNKLSSELEKNIESLKAEIEKERKIDEMRKNLIINVSHELKTPIFLIQSYAEGLKHNITGSEQDKDYYCDVISDESKKMDKIVKDLLNLARLESGKIQLEMTSFRIKEVLDDVLKSCRISIENISMEENVENVSITADKDMIYSLITNLLTNAIDHTPQGGKIKLYSERRGEKLRMYVFNSGSHIPEEDIEKIWQSFYKVDKSHNRSFGGTGIGLSIVKAIMDNHKNEYGVRNENDGVSFYADFDISG